jgi:hypothetical protein
VRVQVFYFDGCLNAHETFELVRRVATEQGVETVVETVEVRSAADAAFLRFLGSPTVQVNGVDIEPSARGRSDFTLACRLYGRSGVPTAEMIAAAIQGQSSRPLDAICKS